MLKIMAVLVIAALLVVFAPGFVALLGVVAGFFIAALGWWLLIPLAPAAMILLGVVVLSIVNR